MAKRYAGNVMYPLGYVTTLDTKVTLVSRGEYQKHWYQVESIKQVNTNCINGGKHNIHTAKKKKEMMVVELGFGVVGEHSSRGVVPVDLNWTRMVDLELQISDILSQRLILARRTVDLTRSPDDGSWLHADAATSPMETHELRRLRLQPMDASQKLLATYFGPDF